MVVLERRGRVGERKNESSRKGTERGESGKGEKKSVWRGRECRVRGTVQGRGRRGEMETEIER